jgi:heme exporter protein C
MWWKILSVILVYYALIGGMLLDVPRQDILNETIRNLYYHVPMWFGMVLLFLGSFISSILYLSKNDIRNDLWACELARAGLLFGMLGMATGMIWAQFTWGSFWSNDPKQNASAIALMIYLAYFVFRGAFSDRHLKSKFSAVYNIFAFSAMIPLIFILPRMTDSLHPGAGGNPAFNIYDLDGRMRIVFYPAVLGWTLFGFWIAQLYYRLRVLKETSDDE